MTGRVGTGKTTLARALGDATGATVITVSEVLSRHMTALSDRPPSREELQAFGAEAVAAGPQRLGAWLLTAAGSAQLVIVDGLRIASVALWLRPRVPHERLRIIFLDAPFPVRRARYDRRGEGRRLADADQHPVEQRVEELRPLSDRVLDASRPTHEIAAEALALL